jgi:phage terminase small subunit
MAGRRAPAHLAPSTAAWWRAVVADYELAEHHERLLTLAGEAWDRAVEAREAIAEYGTFFTDRFGQPRVHPGVAVERDARLAFTRLVRELALDGDPHPGGE